MELKLIKYYPYKIAVTIECYLVLARELAADLECALAQLANTHPGNHTVYVFEDISLLHNKIAVCFSDSKARFGHLKVGSRYQPKY